MQALLPHLWQLDGEADMCVQSALGCTIVDQLFKGGVHEGWLNFSGPTAHVSSTDSLRRHTAEVQAGRRVSPPHQPELVDLHTVSILCSVCWVLNKAKLPLSWCKPYLWWGLLNSLHAPAAAGSPPAAGYAVANCRRSKHAEACEALLLVAFESLPFSA